MFCSTLVALFGFHDPYNRAHFSGAWLDKKTDVFVLSLSLHYSDVGGASLYGRHSDEAVPLSGGYIGREVGHKRGYMECGVYRKYSV